ncbi:helix-turn-helix transcriptional regulator [Xanthomonas vesicatoria]|uniref:Helix-turn-helix transcriptional regulator n=3 Tax=Xanthomonas vesicatoria TaxID=56460 RepID=A0ABS8LE89_9XANT|nr:helix-turn-helix transcriptional regulator [Xanthomonas vesicatoria]APO95129.1 AraC family transcriptional regulator [Xanthomonas vesicatoria]KHM98482.1 transcriptional regulator [Xanthomonas vesicatoria]MCC8624051.1 helix-turn-helix transcriptional regulator [Xanthomonas vesicatoria]MCC8696055.1 helix-turn-helix transcriptional regulator [Xanthomonas vesicatoria]MCC8704201.1 helix-turn-helix transcriptional regulator [Xanthomonas vesicatoria]
MTVAPTPTDTLIAQMASLMQGERADAFACVSARREHGARSVDLSQAQFAIVLQGRQQVRSATQSLQLVPGDLFLATRPCRIDVINTPDPQTGLYMSAVVPLCEEALAAARALWNEPLPDAGADIARLPAIDVALPLRQWRDALQHGLYTEARLALAALVIHVCRRGHGGLLLPPTPSIAEQVRTLIAAQPQRAWRSRDIEDSLGVSGATLRRHLAAEQRSLRDLITDARLAHAMALLYSTRWPLKTVAARAGYRSTRSFSQRFQQRYGLDPASIGNSR